MVTDSKGVVYAGRTEGMDDNKARYARDTDARTLAEVMRGRRHLPRPVGRRRAQARDGQDDGARSDDLRDGQPDTRDHAEEALAVRPDAIIGTGRSDYPNQINNVLCFPFIFRGALDCGATTINEAMKLAAVRALAALAMPRCPRWWPQAYSGERLAFRPRLPDSQALRPAPDRGGRAGGGQGRGGQRRRQRGRSPTWRPIASDWSRFVYQSGSAMQPVFAAAQASARNCRVRLCRGRGRARAARGAGRRRRRMARPLLIGRADDRSSSASAEFGLRLKPGSRLRDHRPARCAGHARHRGRRLHHARGQRDGVSREHWRWRRCASRCHGARRRCCSSGPRRCACCAAHRAATPSTSAPIRNVIGARDGVHTLAVMQMLILPERQLFICDTHINLDPTAEQVADIALLAAAEVRRFGIDAAAWRCCRIRTSAAPTRPSAHKMREARGDRSRRSPDLAVEGEMRGDAALSQAVLDHEFPEVRLRGPANVLVMPNVDAANISYNLLRMAAGSGMTVGRHSARRGKAGPHSHALVHGAAHREHGRRRGRGCGFGAEPDRGDARWAGCELDRSRPSWVSRSWENPAIVIVGGGAGGLELATRLGDKYGRKGKLDITLIDETRTHVWKPKLHEIAAGSMDIARARGRLSRAVVLAPLPLPDRRNDRARPRRGARCRWRRISTTKVARSRRSAPLATTSWSIAVGSQSNDFGTPGVARACDQARDRRRMRRRFHAEWSMPASARMRNGAAAARSAEGRDHRRRRDRRRTCGRTAPHDARSGRLRPRPRRPREGHQDQLDRGAPTGAAGAAGTRLSKATRKVAAPSWASRCMVGAKVAEVRSDGV